jgi:GMP synthase-like glutamine amidotransferase
MRPLRLAILSHSQPTRPDAVVDWAFDRGHAPDVRSIYAGEPLPALEDFDFLVVMGGPMSATDDDRYPWLLEETQLIEKSMAANKAVLGLCLGGQLIARACSTPVVKHEHWEVGWHKVRVEDPYVGKGELVAFQWHQDTFRLPSGATRIASNSVTREQGFRLSSKIVGLQFHPEAVHDWVKTCVEEDPYPEGPYVQDRQEIVRGLIHQPAMNHWFRKLLQQMEGEL